MNRFKKIFILLFGVMACMQIQAQDKIVNPDISYAGTPRTLKIGGINVSGVEGYEDYVLTGISGLSVGDEITVPGDEITNAVKRYWKHGLFSKVAIAADSIVGEKLYLHIYLAVRPRISNINYVGLKKSEREDMEQKVSVLNDSEYTGDEYAQLYKKVIEVLDKMYALLGSEKVGIKEFNKILASGFQEIKIGLIPQTNDCVVIGDIERTRLDNIKVMFFVGINDGNVPKKRSVRKRQGVS